MKRFYLAIQLEVDANDLQTAIHTGSNPLFQACADADRNGSRDMMGQPLARITRWEISEVRRG